MCVDWSTMRLAAAHRKQRPEITCSGRSAKVGFLSATAAPQPSMNRWGSCTENMGEQVAGDMFCGILPRCLDRAFRAWTAGDDEAESDDERKKMRAKTWRAKKTASDPARRVMNATLSWSAEPFDCVWMHLQYVDGRKCGLMDRQHPRDPFTQCAERLADMLLEPLTSSALQTAYRHYVAADEDDTSFVELEQNIVLSMYGQLW